MIFVVYCIGFAIIINFIYNITKYVIKRIKLNKMFKANHNCKNCKHCHSYLAGYCDLDFRTIRYYAKGEEEKIYNTVNNVIGTRKCHWDPKER